jgi:hypothetical protein
MIRLRDHLDELRQADRERVLIFFLVGLALGLFNYYEMTRRGHVNDAKAEHRNEWVDEQLDFVKGELRDTRSRSLARAGVVKAVYAFGILAATAVGAYAAFKGF